MSELIAAIKAFCEANYEAGYDAVVECWGVEEHQNFIDTYTITSVDEFVEAYKPIKDHREEIMSTAY